MFAEDVALIPKGAFSGLLKSLKEAPEQFVPMVGELWHAMGQGRVFHRHPRRAAAFQRQAVQAA